MSRAAISESAAHAQPGLLPGVAEAIQHDRSAGAREGVGDAEPDAAGGAGDKRHHAWQARLASGFLSEISINMIVSSALSDLIARSCGSAGAGGNAVPCRLDS